VKAGQGTLSAKEVAILTDPEAIERFTALYDQHCRQVYAYAVSRAGRQLAEEVVSEVFLITWRRLADVPVPALPWLLTVARNVAIGQFRAAARRQSVAAELQAWTSGPQAVSADVADQVTERLAVLTALAALSEADRELVTLLAWQGLTPRQAAEVVGCSTPTLFVRLHRARRRLERAMDGAAESADGESGNRMAGPAHTPRPVEHAMYRDARGEERQ
jgi:RNA polymerase sigma-70 factor, ECF subfamily